MKKYVKPYILEEVIEIEDVIALSPSGDGDVDNMEETDIDSIFGNGGN